MTFWFVARTALVRFSLSPLQIFLLNVNPAQNEALFIGILKCFAAWISIRAFDENLLLTSPLLASSLDILVTPLATEPDQQCPTSF